MIYIEPLAGLANRMRMIASSLWLSQRLERNLVCHWVQDNELNAPFELLFEPIEGLVVKRRPIKFQYILSSYQTHPLKQLAAVIIQKLIGVDHCFVDYDFSRFVWTGQINLLALTGEHSRFYIKACQEFGENLPFFQKFVPHSDIRVKINEIVSGFDRYTVGMHIRRSDNIKSVVNSPTDLFENKIRELINSNANANFFLCTDDEDVEQSFKRQFGNRIKASQKSLSRRTVSGIQDAVLDMYCLSQTSVIYGSYWSSFSDIAARLGGIELITLKK